MLRTIMNNSCSGYHIAIIKFQVAHIISPLGMNLPITLRESVHLSSCSAILTSIQFQPSYMSMLRTGGEESPDPSLLFCVPAPLLCPPTFISPN